MLQAFESERVNLKKSLYSINQVLFEYLVKKIAFYFKRGMLVPSLMIGVETLSANNKFIKIEGNAEQEQEEIVTVNTDNSNVIDSRMSPAQEEIESLTRTEAMNALYELYPELKELAPLDVQDDDLKDSGCEDIEARQAAEIEERTVEENESLTKKNELE